ncbi:MAG: hypothetical protein KatS3mg090_0860 [Patescibacteria group bacterium]|nr:MAG: hypothetical protein KatS3mg090_0860 [Patescibacteria group bacterium]
MRKNFDLSIIIISYNTAKITKDCLVSIKNSLKHSKLRVQIIVLDNNSKDNSKEVLKSLQKQFKNNLELKLVFSKENLGFSRGNNRAVSEADSDYLLFLNSDTIILNQAIDKLYRFYIKNENKYQFVGPKLYYPNKQPQPSVGKFYNLWVVFLTFYLQGNKLGLTRTSPDKITESDWLHGACFMTKKDYYNKLNGFDEQIFMYMEEVDLFYRAKQKGFKSVFYPKAKIIHLEGASSKTKIKRTFPIIQLYQGLLYFYKKHSYSKASMFVLKALLRIKAELLFFIGKIINNQYLTETYGQAKKIVADFR